MLFKSILTLVPMCAMLGQEMAPAKVVEWGPAAGPWQLSISSNKSHYPVGEAIKVTGTIKNVSDRPVLFLNSTFSLFVIDVRTPMPSWIPMKPKARLLPESAPQPGEAYHVIGVDVPPAWQTARILDLNRLFDMSEPGEYRIKFSTTQPTVTMAEGQAAHDNAKVTVTSNELVIMIVAAGK